MRALLLALVLANVLAFAWWQGLLDPWLAAGRDPDRVTRQVEPAKVRVVPIERLEAARRAAQGGCWEVGPLAEDRFERALGWARAQGAKAEAQPAKPILRLRFAPSASDAERRAGLAELAAESAGEPRPCEPTAAAAGTGTGTGTGTAPAGTATAGTGTTGSTTGSTTSVSGAHATTGAGTSAPAGASSASPSADPGAPPAAGASASSKSGVPAAGASASSKSGAPAAGASASTKSGTPAASASASSKSGTPAAPASASSKADTPSAEGGGAK